MRTFTQKNKNLLLTFSFLFITIFGYSKTHTFPTSGTFIVPAVVTSISIEALSGGAGGTTANSTGSYESKLAATTIEHWKTKKNLTRISSAVSSEVMSSASTSSTEDKKRKNISKSETLKAIANPEINILGNTISILDGDTTPSTSDWTIFGSMETSTGTIIKKYTIQNTGGDALSVGAITISGTNAGDFTVNTSPSASIAPGGTSTFSIRFDPTTVGSKTAAISIVNNDSNENPYNFYIQGTGIQTFFDSDGDGVYDNLDIDDDNDGILDATEEINCNSANGRKVDYKFLNETFGTGGRTSSFTTAYNATTTYCYEDGTGTNCPAQDANGRLDDGEYTVVSKITGTVASDPDNIHGDLAWYNGEDHTPGDTNGRMAVFNASFTPGTFYETTITGVLSNLPITYSFWVLNIMAQGTFPGSKLPNVTVEFYDLSNNLLTFFNTGDIGRCSGSTTDNSCSQGVWKQFTTSVNLGNVNAFTIRFKNNAQGGNGNDLALDDILISQTLCDLDNDGVADMFDLDADNDGIPDVIEVGLGNLSNAKGKIDANWVDTNGNGLLDGAEAIAALPALDSDGDGIPNYIDLDSDNDSLFDVDESGAGNTNATSGFINGDGDITGDGVGDGLESETFRTKDTNGDGITEGFGDGILDIYDYGTVFNQYGNLNQGIATANAATTYLKDTDGDGIPDYLDVKSNGSTFDIANNLVLYDYKTLDTNNNGIIDGTTDVDKDGILDLFDTNTTVFGSPRDIRTKLYLDFDGRNDYAQSAPLLGTLAGASLMAWIDLDPTFSGDGVIVGQNNFQIRVTNTKKLEVVVNGSAYDYNTALNVSQWYNVAATYDGANIKLYLNGALVKTQSKTGAIDTDASLLTIGRNPNTIGPIGSSYFKGKIDEVRVFNIALTDSQLQKMVYQEIKNFGSEIRGEIVPKNVATMPSSLPFTNLLRYYRMDNYKDNVIDDLTTAAIDITGTKIYNFKNIHLQQAPMPFLTERNGTFSAAVNNATKDIRGDDVMEQDWSIIKVQHDITETANNIDLAMFVDPGKNIVMNNDNKIQNDWYLKLDGKIDLVGKSQLVQTTESDLDISSSGSIERDQLGQSNKYNYNYWSSPVSPINTTTNNTAYTVAGIMKDGTTSTPQNISWIGGYDGSPNTPIALARYWIYKFDNAANAYANWSQIGETGALRVGQGFTLKGSGALSGTQNYTFVGKPNNSTIASNSVGANQLILTGNPYPSALDANAFINDNMSSIDGTLYFWEHYTTNNTHILRDYQGGYAERNLTGGVPPTSAGVDFISGLGSTTRGIPNQFIPVGQSFFVNGNSSAGGPITYKNTQRGFHKEDELGVSNIMYKAVPNKKEEIWNNNNNDFLVKDTYKRIRLGYNSNNNYHRQVLLGFMDDKATSKIDKGYDGYNFDNFPHDMYFLIDANQFVIQGVGSFDINSSYPIGVKADIEGKVTFMIDGLENFDKNEKIFIFDSKDATYHDIRKKNYEVIIPSGQSNDRFYLCFTTKKEKDPKVKDDEKEKESTEVKITHLQKKNVLKINNESLTAIVQKVTLFNMLGQSIESWSIENATQQDLQLPLKNLSSGIYIVRIQTSNGDLSKKIIVP